MSKRAIWALVVGAIILAVALAAYGLPPQQICETGDPGQKSCALYDLPLFVLIKIAEFIEGHEAFFTATATIAIAVFTAILGWSTNKLWLTGEAQAKVATQNATSTRRAATAALQSNAIARENMQREQRPFVYVNKPSIAYTTLIDTILGDTAPVTLVIRNYGLTPAKDVKLVTKCHVGGIWNDPFKTSFDDVAVVYLGDIPPRDQKQRSGYYVHGLSEAATDIRAGVRTVFVEGVINYRDAFGNSYVTAFRFASTEQEFDHSDWSETPEGNSAD